MIDWIRRRDGFNVAAATFLAANLLHGADHLRQGIGELAGQVKVGGGVITAAAVVVLVLVVRRHPRAPFVATVVGLASAVLVVQSHLLPHWSMFSDSYIDDVDADALSWVIVLTEVVAALVLGFIGWSRLRRQKQSDVGVDGMHGTERLVSHG